MHLKASRGFTLIEIIVVIAIIVVVFTITFPLYLDYNKRNELRQGAKQVRNEIEFTVSQASNGVVPVFPSPTPTSDQSYWLIRIPAEGSGDTQLIRAACAVEDVADSSCTINNGIDRSVINLNSGVRLRHTASAYASVPLVLYFSPVFAQFTVRTADGTVTTLTSLELIVEHDELGTTEIVTLNINSQGKITENSAI